jgi:hypothetical protein
MIEVKLSEAISLGDMIHGELTDIAGYTSNND